MQNPTSKNKTHDLSDDEYEDLINNDVSCDKHYSNLSDTSVSPEVYMSVVWHTGYVGIAYYDLISLQIHIMADVPENKDFSLVKQIIRELQPMVIILSSLHDSGLITCLKKEISDGSPMSERSNVCKLEFLPNSDFSYEVSKRRILSMKLPSVPQHFTDEERKLYFTSLLGLDNMCMVRSVGGLLKYLNKTRVGIELEDTATSVPILGFRVFTLESHIQINMQTYKALNIFHTESHPSVYKFGTGSSKEGLSLFGILNRCKSSYGSRMLRQWCLHPLRNASVLGQRYDAISFFLSPSNTEPVSCLQDCLKNIKYIPRILMRMSKAQATIGDWIALSKTLYHAVYIGETCRASTKNVEILRKIGIAFTDDLQYCYNLLRKTIDFEASKQNKRFVVQANVDEKLDAKKRIFNGLPDLLTRVAREELEGLSSDIQACVVSYLPQIGYLLVIDMPEGKSEADDHTIEGLEYKFTSDNQVFYKSPKTLELDRILGDTQLEIIDMEVAIMHHLQDVILEKTQLILDVMEMTAELDCLMALTACADEFGYVRPTLIEEAAIDIKAGRHPLQELCCAPYVPNNTSMGGQHSKMKLLTGPNACGKSVYLKQVSLITFMAHIGSFVPAEQANIGPVDKIFSCIKSVESVATGLSTFMQDNIQVSSALQEATPNSLVIVDEYGKGTESTDGLALLTAVIKFWIAKGSACPLVLISTHFHSIIQQKLLPPSPQLQLLTFETVMNGDELVFLYQIREGYTSCSYACNVATQAGISEAIIKRAKEVSRCLAENKPVPHIKDSCTQLQNERNEKIVNAFLKLNLDTDDLSGFLKGFVLPLCSEQQHKTQPVHVSDEVQNFQDISQATQKSKQQIFKGSKHGKSEEVTEINVDMHRSELCVDKTLADCSNNPNFDKDKTTICSVGQNLVNNKTKWLSEGQNLDKDQGDIDKIPARPEKCDIANLTKNINRDLNATLWKNQSIAHKEHFTKTPLFESKQINTIHEQSVNQFFFRHSPTCIEHDRSEPLSITDKQSYEGPLHCSKTRNSEKRKADMRFLFTGISKQAKSSITPLNHTENQTFRSSSTSVTAKIANLSGAAGRRERGNQSCSSIVPLTSETYSDEEHDRSFTTQLSSVESHSRESTAQIKKA